MYGLDLFSGIGGITKALEGYVEPVAYCERDRYAQAVLLSRMVSQDIPKAPIWDDILTLKGNMLPKSTEIIYGGFPCQDLSTCRNGAGLAGKRSGLFFEIIRLVSEIQPRFVFLENVSAITKRGLVTVTGEFAKLRYDCRWGVLSAEDVGANQKRERWFLLAYSYGDRRRNDIPEKGQHNIKALPSTGETKKIDLSAHCDEAFYGVDHSSLRVADGIPNWVDRIRSCGNAVVPAQAREAFERLMGLK